MSIILNEKIYINDIKPNTDIKVKDIYVKNSNIENMYRKAIWEYSGISYDSEFIVDKSNFLKKEKQFFNCLGDNIKNSHMIKKEYCFTLEEAALFIAYCYFSCRSKNAISYKIYSGKLNTISGNQLLAYLALASEIAIYFKNQKIKPYENSLKKLPKIEDFDYIKKQFTPEIYSEHSEKFQKLVKDSMIEANREELCYNVYQSADEFFKNQFTKSIPSDSISENTNIFEALTPIHIKPELKLNEEDAYEISIIYFKGLQEFSAKSNDAMKILSKFLKDESFQEYDTSDFSKKEIYKMILNILNQSENGQILYEQIKNKYIDTENPSEYLNELFEYVKAELFVPIF